MLLSPAHLKSWNPVAWLEKYIKKNTEKEEKKKQSHSSDPQITDTIAHNGAKTVTFISLFLIVLNLELIDRTAGNDTFRTVMVWSDNLSISPMVY